MKHFIAIADAIDRYQRCVGQAVSWLTLAMVIMMFFIVTSRYAFNSNAVWQQELVGFMHAIVFLVGAGFVLLENKHVRVDILYQGFSLRSKAWVDIIGSIALLIPFAIALLYFSYGFVLHSWKIHEHSPEHDGMPGVFLLKTCIWVFAVNLIAQAVSHILRALVTLRTREVSSL